MSSVGDGVYRTTEGLPVFHAVRAPTATGVQVLLSRIIKRIMKFLTRKGYLIQEQGMTYLTDTDLDLALGPLQAAACAYRTAQVLEFLALMGGAAHRIRRVLV